MVYQQQTEEIDAFIRSLREKALERHRRSSRLTSEMEDARQRLVDQRERFSIAAAPAEFAPPDPSPSYRMSSLAEPVTRITAPASTPYALDQAARSAASWNEAIEARSEPVPGQVAEHGSSETRVAEKETERSASFGFELAEEIFAADEPDERDWESPDAPAISVFAGPAPVLPEFAAPAQNSPAARAWSNLPDLSAFGVSWEPSPAYAPPAETVIEVDPQDDDDPDPGNPGPLNGGGSRFVRSRASAHMFEPHAPQPLAGPTDDAPDFTPAERNSDEASGFYRYAPKPDLGPPLPPSRPAPEPRAEEARPAVEEPKAAALPLKKLAQVETPKPSVLKLPFLEEGGDPQIQMIATAVQAAATQHHTRPVGRPAPSFSTMSAYDQAAGRVVEEVEIPQPRFKVTMTRQKKRSLWPFGAKKAA